MNEQPNDTLTGVSSDDSFQDTENLNRNTLWIQSVHSFLKSAITHEKVKKSTFFATGFRFVCLIKKYEPYQRSAL